jgi:hypothetical protein
VRPFPPDNQSRRDGTPALPGERNDSMFRLTNRRPQATGDIESMLMREVCSAGGDTLPFELETILVIARLASLNAQGGQ